MLASLWASRSVNQVRGVMVVGSSILLALSVYLTIDYIELRQAGATGEMLFTASTVWYAPLHICYSVGVDGISVAMLLLSSIIVFTGTFCIVEVTTIDKRIFHVVHSIECRGIRILRFNRPVHHVHVL